MAETNNDKAPCAAESPQTGPRILFFSGGTALRGLSRRLVHHTHNSVHLITPFDSGGSSAAIREAFDMPAVGDLRNRLMALADPAASGRPAIFRLMVHRLGKSAHPEILKAQLSALCDGSHRLMEDIPKTAKDIVRRHLRTFEAAMPTGFDLGGASIGNLLIAGGFLGNGRQLEPVLDEFAGLIGAKGTVAPIVHDNLHLAVELEDGTQFVGQHRITGKETAPIASPIRRAWLTSSLDSTEAVATRIEPSVSRMIEGADLICFPMGSFYSSVMANLLPAGVGKAVASAKCPKVYLPNLGHDPEAIGLTVLEATRRLLRELESDAGTRRSGGRLIDHVLLDSAGGHYPGTVSASRFGELGIRVVDAPLVTRRSAPLLDEDLLIGTLMSLV